MKKNMFISLMAVMAFLLTADSAMACSCVLPDRNKTDKQLVTEAKKGSTAVFVGKVVSIRYSDEKIDGTPVSLIARFHVERSWKGGVAEFVEVTTANICCICGVGFVEGEKYVVYSNRTAKGQLTASSCSRTSGVKDKAADAKYLGKAKVFKRS